MEAIQSEEHRRACAYSEIVLSDNFSTALDCGVCRVNVCSRHDVPEVLERYGVSLPEFQAYVRKVHRYAKATT
jgi:hypothetical protein